MMVNINEKKNNSSKASKIRSGLESIMNKARGFKKSIAIATICLSVAAGYTGGNMIGHQSGYRESVAQQIYAEQKIRQSGYRYFEKIDEKYCVVADDYRQVRLANMNGKTVAGPYDKITPKKDGCYECLRFVPYDSDEAKIFSGAEKYYFESTPSGINKVFVETLDKNLNCIERMNYNRALGNLFNPD